MVDPSSTGRSAEQSERSLLMNAATKFTGFTLGLAAVFGIALAVGATLGPESTESAHDSQGHADMGESDELPAGLMASENGYTLRLDTPQTTAAANFALRFRILNRDG